MLNQLALFTKKTLEDRFNEWMNTYHGMKVFSLFVAHALEFRSRGRRMGAKAIVEHLRYYHSINSSNPPLFSTNCNFPSALLIVLASFIFDKSQNTIEHEGEEFKIDNSYTSYMVREAVYRYPKLAGYFTMKELKR